tara:strand:- start:212 stop:652 length:441 start_codon:yes stop_codon:yes gene_type:complete
MAYKDMDERTRRKFLRNLGQKLMPQQAPIQEEKPTEIVGDEDSLKDFCCQKAASELEALLQDVVERYRREGKREKEQKFQSFLDNIEGRNCEEIKSALRFMAKIGKVAPKGQKINPEVERAREILDDLERCQGMKKSWFKVLKERT